MPKGERVATDLVGQAIQFDKVPNEQVSEQLGVIRAVYVLEGGLRMQVQLLKTDRLVEWSFDLGHYRLTKPGSV